MKLKQVTISDGETDSEVIDTKDPNVRLDGIFFPTMTSATTFTLKMSLDGTNFYPILDSSGSIVEFNLLADGDCYVPTPWTYTEGLDYFKVTLASTASADVVLTPVAQRLIYP